MSHGSEPEPAARRPPATILAILIALAVAGIALIWWMGADPVDEGEVNKIIAPEAPLSGAESGPPED